MLEVKKDRAAGAPGDPTTAQYVDRMERKRRPITLRIDDRPPLVIEDARLPDALGMYHQPHRGDQGGARGPVAGRTGPHHDAAR